MHGKRIFLGTSSIHLKTTFQKLHSYEKNWLFAQSKIRKAKAKTKFNLATGIKDNKKLFYSKGRAKENLQPLLDVARYVTTEDKEKAKVLNAFFTSISKSQTNYSWGSPPPDLEV